MNHRGTAAESAASQALHPDIDVDRLVFIDETGASRKMAHLNARSPRIRAVCIDAHGHWKTATFLGA